ncbi:MAG: hypothetical protein DRJ08_06445 [Acidobacteria bacterium]|nr:MAG: hypothetical protein DRJ14_08295 [Acidobacteriota bacterium]RLE20822.1 MAG: hypothetical protein DRJ08_06445 [Acidobacteriota bacterium]
MRIEVAKIEQRPLRGDFRIQKRVMDPGSTDTFTVDDCVVEFELYRISESEIMLKAHYFGSLELACTTCLEMYETKVDERFSVLFTSTPGEVEGVVTPEGYDSDVQLLEGDVIELERQVLDTMRLNIPMSHQCRENCRGICPTCGKNLNEGDCNCVIETVDPRWKDLELFLNKKE